MNVQDRLKGLTKDQIIEQLLSESMPAMVGMHNLTGNLNLGGIIRTANFLGFRKVMYFGRRKWDKRGSVGTYNYTPLEYFTDEDAFLDALSDWNIVALENNTNYHCQDMLSFEWPEKTFIMAGSEAEGLPDRILDAAHSIVSIPGNGSVRSLNVSTAASMAMYDYYSKVNS